MKNWMLILLLLSLMACSQKGEELPTEIKYGKNTFQINVDGLPREFIVHVPKKYDGSAPVPVVLMLHGTAQNGEEMYTNSGWKDVGETENLLTVFPSSLQSCIIADGVQKSTTKWNAQPVEDWKYCAGITPPDDLKFLEAILTDIAMRYNINSKKIYLVGFSNGGQMAAKCSILLSHKLAAIVESAGTFAYDTTLVPKRKIPVTFQIGNDDHGPNGTGPELSMSKLSQAIHVPGHSLYRVSQTEIKSFALNPKYTIGGDTTSIASAHYKPLSSNDKHEFNILLIKGLKHAYPDGSNHWYKAAESNWEWMKIHSLP